MSALRQALGTWAQREITEGPSASQIRAGHRAVAAIDDMTAVLHKVRQQLVTELWADEDERARRVDQMISDARRSGGEG
jgi:C4-type Zn-finger protein